MNGHGGERHAYVRLALHPCDLVLLEKVLPLPFFVLLAQTRRP
jgi:hypothetical protein